MVIWVVRKFLPLDVSHWNVAMCEAGYQSLIFKVQTPGPSRRLRTGSWFFLMCKYRWFHCLLARLFVSLGKDQWVSGSHWFYDFHFFSHIPSPWSLTDIAANLFLFIFLFAVQYFHRSTVLCPCSSSNSTSAVVQSVISSVLLLNDFITIIIIIRNLKLNTNA